MDILINKICRFLPNKEKATMLSIITTQKSINTAMETIYPILYNFIRKWKLTKSKDRQNFISSKILDYLKSIDMISTNSITNNSMIGNSITMIDIGGGNGNVLSSLNEHLKLDRSNFICLETKTDWMESYPFDNDNITYLFWENTCIDMSDQSVDIVICMCSLHHMSDMIVSNLLSEITRILKPNGKLLIKEHDCSNIRAQYFIEWEHHLYHMLDCAYNNKPFYYETYMKQINNFKSKEQWQRIMERNGLQLTNRLNRFLEINDSDTKNITNLYWDVYTIPYYIPLKKV